MHKLQVMGREGHRSMTWEPQVQEQVDAAGEEFARCLLDGYIGFCPGKGRIKEFDANTERIVMVPPMQGG